MGPMDARNKPDNMRTIVLGAGRAQRVEGAVHHDRIPFSGIDIVFDLNEHKWPITNRYELIICTHVVEHLHSLINFMDNCHDILDVDGVLEIITPNAGVNPDLEFCDPTHVRCYRKHTFMNYFTRDGIEKLGYTLKEWRINSIYSFRTEISDDTIFASLTKV